MGGRGVVAADGGLQGGVWVDERGFFLFKQKTAYEITA